MLFEEWAATELAPGPLADEASHLARLSLLRMLQTDKYGCWRASVYPIHRRPQALPRRDDVTLDVDAYDGDAACCVHEPAGQSATIHSIESAPMNDAALVCSINTHESEGRIPVDMDFEFAGSEALQVALGRVRKYALAVRVRAQHHMTRLRYAPLSWGHEQSRARRLACGSHGPDGADSVFHATHGDMHA